MEPLLKSIKGTQKNILIQLPVILSQILFLKSYSKDLYSEILRRRAQS